MSKEVQAKVAVLRAVWVKAAKRAGLLHDGGEAHHRMDCPGVCCKKASVAETIAGAAAAAVIQRQTPATAAAAAAAAETVNQMASSVASAIMACDLQPSKPSGFQDALLKLRSEAIASGLFPLADKKAAAYPSIQGSVGETYAAFKDAFAAAQPSAWKPGAKAAQLLQQAQNMTPPHHSTPRAVAIPPKLIVGVAAVGSGTAIVTDAVETGDPGSSADNCSTASAFVDGQPIFVEGAGIGLLNMPVIIKSRRPRHGTSMYTVEVNGESHFLDAEALATGATKASTAVVVEGETSMQNAPNGSGRVAGPAKQQGMVTGESEPLTLLAGITAADKKAGSTHGNSGAGAGAGAGARGFGATTTGADAVVAAFEGNVPTKLAHLVSLVCAHPDLKPAVLSMAAAAIATAATSTTVPTPAADRPQRSRFVSEAAATVPEAAPDVAAATALIATATETNVSKTPAAAVHFSTAGTSSGVVGVVGTDGVRLTNGHDGTIVPLPAFERQRNAKSPGLNDALKHVGVQQIDANEAVLGSTASPKRGRSVDAANAADGGVRRTRAKIAAAEADNEDNDEDEDEKVGKLQRPNQQPREHTDGNEQNDHSATVDANEVPIGSCVRVLFRGKKHAATVLQRDSLYDVEFDDGSFGHNVPEHQLEPCVTSNTACIPAKRKVPYIIDLKKALKKAKLKEAAQKKVIAKELSAKEESINRLKENIAVAAEKADAEIAAKQEAFGKTLATKKVSILLLKEKAQRVKVQSQEFIKGLEVKFATTVAFSSVEHAAKEQALNQKVAAKEELIEHLKKLNATAIQDAKAGVALRGRSLDALSRKVEKSAADMIAMEAAFKKQQESDAACRIKASSVDLAPNKAISQAAIVSKLAAACKEIGDVATQNLALTDKMIAAASNKAEEVHRPLVNEVMSLKKTLADAEARAVQLEQETASFTASSHTLSQLNRSAIDRLTGLALRAGVDQLAVAAAARVVGRD